MEATRRATTNPRIFESPYLAYHAPPGSRPSPLIESIIIVCEDKNAETIHKLYQLKNLKRHLSIAPLPSERQAIRKKLIGIFVTHNPSSSSEERQKKMIRDEVLHILKNNIHSAREDADWETIQFLYTKADGETKERLGMYLGALK